MTINSSDIVQLMLTLRLSSFINWTEETWCWQTVENVNITWSWKCIFALKCETGLCSIKPENLFLEKLENRSDDKVVTEQLHCSRLWFDNIFYFIFWTCTQSGSSSTVKRFPTNSVALVGSEDWQLHAAIFWRSEGKNIPCSRRGRIFVDIPSTL